MSRPRTAFCIPIFEDWTSAAVLLARLDVVAAERDLDATVLLVDDGSNSAPPDDFAADLSALRAVNILRLRRNLGHQRAIAIGLTHLYEETDADRVVVMDGDGEDRPEDVPALLDRLETSPDHAVFAARARRTESLTFRAYYQAYKAIHLLLTGRKVEVGNFSVLPRSVVSRLIAVAEMWNQYSAAVFNARVKIETLPLARGTRIDGRSQMSFVSLAVHGLSAMSVYSAVIGVRLLMAACALIGVCFCALVGLGALALLPDLELPSWTPFAVLGLLLLTFNALLLGVVFVFVTLQSRNAATFLPLRDWRYYVESVRTVPPADEAA